MADYFGDATGRLEGRATPDPHPHIMYTPFMTVIFPILTWLTIGHGRWAMGGGACPVSPDILRRHKWGEFWVSFAGPLVNLAIGLLAIVVFVFTPDFAPGDPSFSAGARPSGAVQGIAYVAFWVALSQVAIALFNLLPIPPMDGSHMLANGIRPLRSIFDSWQEMFGMWLPILIGWPLFQLMFDYVLWPIFGLIVQLRAWI